MCVRERGEERRLRVKLLISSPPLYICKLTWTVRARMIMQYYYCISQRDTIRNSSLRKQAFGRACCSSCITYQSLVTESVFIGHLITCSGTYCPASDSPSTSSSSFNLSFSVITQESGSDRSLHTVELSCFLVSTMPLKLSLYPLVD